MPAYSTVDLIYEIYAAITSTDNLHFTLDELVQRINRSRKKSGENKKVRKESVNRILTRLWLPLGVRKTVSGTWEKGAGPIRGTTNVRPDIVYKVIHDQKIDATPKQIDRWVGLGEEPTTHKAYICYPYHDDPLRRSLELLILLILLYPKAKGSFVPATPHEMYWGLEEKTDRRTAMIKCEQLVKKSDFLLYCLRKTDKPSNGMKKDMDVAKGHGLEIRYVEGILGYYPEVPEIMERCNLSARALSEFAVPTIANAVHASHQ